MCIRDRLLGERYAENLGVNIRRVRNWLLIITGLLTAVTTAFCGPVAFIDVYKRQEQVRVSFSYPRQEIAMKQFLGGQ